MPEKEFEDLTDDEFTAFMNSLSDKEKKKYNKLSPEAQKINRQAYKERLKYNGVQSALNAPKDKKEEAANYLPNNEIVQDTLRGGVEQNKAGKEVRTGLGSVEGGDKPLGERLEELRDPTPAAPKDDKPSGYGNLADYVTAKNKDGGSGLKDYLVADALATFARNTGKDIGNVAAAYSGGTMNNDREASLLEKRNAQKAQAETEQQIGKEYSNSRLGQELRSRGLDIDTQAGRLAMANNVKRAMYKADGSLKYPADSPAYRDLATLYGQLTSGGGSRDSILSGFARLLNQGISTIW